MLRAPIRMAGARPSLSRRRPDHLGDVILLTYIASAVSDSLAFGGKCADVTIRPKAELGSYRPQMPGEQTRNDHLRLFRAAYRASRAAFSSASLAGAVAAAVPGSAAAFAVEAARLSAGL